MLIEAFIYYFWRPNSIVGSTLFQKVNADEIRPRFCFFKVM